FGGRLGEAYDPVQPVVVGDRERGESEFRGRLGHGFRRGGPVEEAVRRVGVQFRVRHGVAWAGARRRRVPATRTGPGGRVAAVAGVRVLGAAWVRAPGQDSFEFGPALGPV